MIPRIRLMPVCTPIPNTVGCGPSHADVSRTPDLFAIFHALLHKG